MGAVVAVVAVAQCASGCCAYVVTRSYARDMSVIAADDVQLASLGTEEAERSDSLTLRIMYNAHGGADVVSCGDFAPALKLLCFECHLGGEWKQQQCCCLKVNCTVC